MKKSNIEKSIILSKAVVDSPKLVAVFNNTSQIYKFLWLLSILDFIEEGKKEIEFGSIIDKMIIKSWYMVLEYHLNLGVGSVLKQVIEMCEVDSGLVSTSSEKDIKEYLLSTTIIKNQKKKLIKNVPYRFLNPYISIEELTKKYGESDEAQDKIIEEINKVDNAFYKISKYNELKTYITIDGKWFDYLLKNIAIVRDFVKYCMIEYLQDRNPTVPGIMYKIEKPEERKLDDVRNLWKHLIGLKSVNSKIDIISLKKDIYTGNSLVTRDISIDHFIPFQYISSDEFYNLTPVSKSLNSKKSNYLPDNFSTSFKNLLNQQFAIYELFWNTNEKNMEMIDNCWKKHLNNETMINLFYDEGHNKEYFGNVLEEYTLRQYKNAEAQGFMRKIIA